MPKPTDDPHEDLQLGLWLALAEVTQVEAATAGKCSQSYVANLISGEKDNPSALILLRIARSLGVTVNDLYERPPSANETAAFSRLSPQAQTTVMRLRSKRS